MQAKESLLKLVAGTISLLLISFSSVFSQEIKPEYENEDSLIAYHFKKLETAVRLKPKDTIYYCCSGSIMYIEMKSRISSKSDGTLAGKLYFTKSDFIKWRKWYLSRHNVPKQSSTNL